MKGRCGTCKNWRRNKEGCLKSDYGECVGGFIYEKDWSTQEFMSSNGVVASATGQYQAELKTGIDFGCIHHSPLPEGETK